MGYDISLGYLENGFDTCQAAKKDVETIDRINSDSFEARFNEKSPMVIDVRKKSEFDSEHVVGATNIPLNEINAHLAEIPKNEPFILHCAGGYRSMIAASILKQRGWQNFVDVEGGFAEIKQKDVAVTDYVEPKSLL